MQTTAVNSKQENVCQPFLENICFDSDSVIDVTFFPRRVRFFTRATVEQRRYTYARPRVSRTSYSLFDKKKKKKKKTRKEKINLFLL